MQNMGYVISLWHSLSLPYNYLALIVQVVLDMFERVDEQQMEDRRMTAGHGYTISPEAESLAQVS